MAQDDRNHKISQRAHEMWNEQGKPHGKDVEHWLHAEREVNETGKGGKAGANEGEGSRSAAHHYEEGVKGFIKSGRVSAKAQEAKKALEGPEGKELQQAEEAGKRARTPRGRKPAGNGTAIRH